VGKQRPIGKNKKKKREEERRGEERRGDLLE